jgi:phenylalanyl-tRNA synthetase beta chain
VLSLPPILNGSYSAMTEETRNVFLDVTGVDLTKSVIVLNTMVAMFAQFCAAPFSVEQVTVRGPGEHESRVYPDLSERRHDASLAYVNSILGLKLSGEKALELLGRMGLRGALEGPDTLAMRIPITRSDVMEQCDIAEDVAIAYGYNNLTKRTPFVACFGAQQETNKFTDLLRQEIARCNYAEVLTEVLVSWEENFDKLRKPRDDSCVVLSAPKSKEFQIGRTSIIPGILK